MTAALITDPFAHWADSLHHADPLTLAHEAERLAYEMPSPLVVRMRAELDAVRRQKWLDQLTAMLRHAAEHHDAHHLAALAEIGQLHNTSDAAFRADVTDILAALYRVQEEIG